jgi:hypothetical protein
MHGMDTRQRRASSHTPSSSGLAAAISHLHLSVVLARYHNAQQRLAALLVHVGCDEAIVILLFELPQLHGRPFLGTLDLEAPHLCATAESKSPSTYPHGSAAARGMDGAHFLFLEWLFSGLFTL